VLKHDNLQTRVATIVHFIEIAYNCVELNNFNTVLEIIAGLENSSIHRLRRTWIELGKNERITKLFEEMKSIIPHNYKKYRVMLSSCTPPVIPYVGVWQTDLTFIYEGNTDTVKVGKSQLINVLKTRLVANILRLLTHYQSGSYILKEVPEIRKWILFREEISESEAYNRSLAIESRKLMKLLKAEQDS